MKDNMNINHVDIKNRLNDFILLLKSEKIIKTNQDIVNSGIISKSSLSRAVNGDVKYLTKDFITRLVNKFPYNNTSFSDIWEGSKDGLHDEKETYKTLNNLKTNKQHFSNGKLIEKEYFKEVTLIPAKAQLGLQGTMFKEDFIGKLDTKIIATEDNWQGRYFEIEAEGDSMINFDEPEFSIYDGDELTVREIPREMYINSKLHIHDWREFTFFHYEKNIFTKNVLEHDVEGRRVLVHSYNNDFEDEWIDLNDCYIVCNVISVTRPRGFKKRIKKLSK